MVHVYNERRNKNDVVFFFAGSIQSFILTFLYKVLHPIIIRIFK